MILTLHSSLTCFHGLKQKSSKIDFKSKILQFQIHSSLILHIILSGNIFHQKPLLVLYFVV